MVKLWVRSSTVVVVSAGDYRIASSLKRRKRNWLKTRKKLEKKKIGKNWFRLVSAKESENHCVIAIGSLEVIGICLPSHQPDEYDASPSQKTHLIALWN